MSGRCFCCGKKTGLVKFECKCGEVFCMKHRHPEDHACTFDHKAVGRSNIEAANPKIVAPKVVHV